MSSKRKVEVFSAGCAVCEETVERVTRLACSSCEVTVLDIRTRDAAQRAKLLGVRAIPAVAINGKLADCCAGRGPDKGVLHAAGLGQP